MPFAQDLTIGLGLRKRLQDNNRCFRKLREQHTSILQSAFGNLDRQIWPVSEISLKSHHRNSQDVPAICNIANLEMVGALIIGVRLLMRDAAGFLFKVNPSEPILRKLQIMPLC